MERFFYFGSAAVVQKYFLVFLKKGSLCKAKATVASMQKVRIIEIPRCKMVSSGLGMFGEENFTSFCEWFSGLPRSIYPKDFLYAQGEQLCWLYVYDAALDVPQGFDIIDFEGGLYSVATDIDLQTDMDEMDREVLEFLDQNGFVPDESRFKLGNVITSPAAYKTLGYHQMDYYLPIKPK